MQMKGKFFLAVAVCLFLVGYAEAQNKLQVNEAETQAVFFANKLDTNLIVENYAQSFSGQIQLEVLDADDKILSHSETVETIKRGKHGLLIPLDFTQTQAADSLLWYRLRYAITRENSPVATSGIVSLSEIMPELFELQISTSGKIFAGMRLRVHVLALHPLTKKPIKNVNIAGEILLDDELKINAIAKTNGEGFASLDFEIPAAAKLDDEGEITIKGEKNGITRQADKYVDYAAGSFVYLNLDKPIYQPNQKFFARGLYLNSANRPMTDMELDFEISDEEGKTVYEQTVKTSRFGIANINWQIPANIKLGKYRLEVKNDEDDRIGASEFKITRYDLPNFSVSAKTDRTFYLPEQKMAEISVGADYLFGKPVTKGKARVVRETERRWNYEAQKWEIEEAKSYEGVLNEDGKFIAQIDLSEAHENLRGDNWKRFEDLHFAAYFTDVSTNRTEQKRFDVRITKEAIHIYFIRYNSDVNPKLPFQFYVSTFYADGNPARCSIDVKGKYQNLQEEKNLSETKTNSYGASKLEIRIPEKPFPEAADRYFLQISARDKHGNGGTFADSVYLEEKQKQIRVKTDKTIYLPGENIEVKFFSTETDKIVLVDVVQNSSVVYSKRVKLDGGRGNLQIPFRHDFKGELTISAYFRDEPEGDPIYFAKTVIFPSNSDLKFNIKSLKTVYRPNEEAKISFNVRDGNGNAAETALGVVVLDKAIEDRAQTEKLPDNYESLRGLIGANNSFGNLSRRDLNNLDISKPITADFQLAAEFLLINQTDAPRFFESDSYQDNFSRIFKNYFVKKLQPFENALNIHSANTGEFPTNESLLRQILSANNINFDELRDAWGTSFAVQFETDRSFTVLRLITAGADKKFETEDDFTVKEMRFDWFTKTQNRLTTILNNYTQANKKPPITTDELKAVWKESGFDFDALRDGWNRPPYLTSVRYNRDTQKVFLESIGNLDGETQQVERTKLVSQEVILFTIRSAGADAGKNVYDDFDLGSFTVVLSEKNNDEAPPSATIFKSKTINSSGAITGTIFDPNGAVIPYADITAVNQSSKEEFSVISNNDGVYLLANLPSGKYKISVNLPGFQPTTAENVVVNSMYLIKLDFNLYVAGATMTVDVTADGLAAIDPTDTKIQINVEKQKSISDAINLSKGAQIATPRVREYFPETLLWQPELITDKNGKVELKFKLADSLTTWKLYAVASTETGEVGLIEKELQTFQPFFAELEPPKILTEGDEIALPVTVRNYTASRQKVAVSMAENSWSKLLNGATQQIEIAPNTSQNAIFNFRAVAPVKDGKQKVTALAKGEDDAIEKNVTVKPNGKEIVETQAKLFRDSAAFDINFPANAFPNTRQAELKIYPNMLAHVAESVEGLLKRPYGCGEQTTSSTYPNLLILKIEKDLGKSVNAKIKAQAQIYLQEGYERLLNYQTSGGGFSYWGENDTPNVALTAYILRFLNDARDFIAVDEKVVENAANWLLSQQQSDGSWKTGYVEVHSSTAFVARSLSLNIEKNEKAKKSLQSGLEFLKKRLPEIKDSYVLANFALASTATGDTETAEIIADKLNSLSQEDKETLFWTTANTPFHAWGTTAKIETTALAMQTFLRLDKAEKFDTPILRGLAFLLKNKDKYGVWHSTQTTINVLDALILLQKPTKNKQSNLSEKAEVFINGEKIQDFTIDANSLSNPVSIDISSYVSETANRIEIRNAGNSNFMQAQIVADYYISWNDVAEESDHFDLQINFDKTEAKIGEEINCSVSIARKTSRYGMILAEIGIPPGADVSPDSLEKAKTEGDISSFDILPDKIIVYLWTNSAPTKFNFKFRPRYGINAQNAASVVYDYYNTEANATIAPVRFLIR